MSRFDDLIAGMDHALTLFALQEVGVFAALLGGPRPVAELATLTKTDEPRLEAYLDLAVALGALVRSGQDYGIVPGDEDLFDPASERVNPLDAPPLTEWIPRRSRLAEILRSGTAVPVAGGGGDVSAEERRAFLLHLDAQSREVAHEVAALLAPRPWGRVVDVGCGLGTYAYALLKRRPGSVATLVDRPNAREPILERAEELGLVDRVTFADVDILGGDYGDTFDLAVLSNILHDYGEKDAKALLANAARRLVPGGLVAIKDYDIDADHRGSLDALTFRMCMAAFTDGGTLWSEAKVVSWLNELGLTHTATHALRADRGSYLVVGQVP